MFIELQWIKRRKMDRASSFLEWKRMDKILGWSTYQFFENELDGKKEIITFAEIRKYSLTKLFLIPLCGIWHEYTLVKTSNWWWSFEKTMEGIFVQRKKEQSQEFGNEVRTKDFPQDRSSDVSYRENIVGVANWIINRNELGNDYYVTERNCHYFASLLYEAIIRSKGRRLDNTV